MRIRTSKDNVERYLGAPFVGGLIVIMYNCILINFTQSLTFIWLMN